MTEEFGYDIVFRYRGSDGLSKFQKDADKVKSTLNKIIGQATRIKKTTQAVQELTRTAFAEADKDAISASKRRIQLLKEQEQNIKRIATAQKAEDARQLQQQNRLANIARTNAQLAAAQERRQQQAALAAQRLAAAQQRAAQQQVRFNQQQQRSAARAAATSERARAAAIGHSNAIGSAIARTVRFFLLFKTVQEAIQLTGRAISESVNFAALLEESEKQIAGLILSVGEVRNEIGEVVDAAEGLPIAMGLSRRILKDLQADAVVTAATFRELISALQVSIAPGLANGLDVDQVRKLTVTFSQAASALGIAQRDLAEEIRSTLQGTINARNTRIATALGITNEDIRIAKEAGELYEFLTERMAGVSSAAKSLQSSLTVLRSNFQDVLEIAGAAGFLPLFDSLKATFTDLIDLFTVGTLEDGVKIEPAVVETIRFAAEGLSAIVESFREFAKSDDAAELATSLAVAFGDLGKAIGEALPGILSGLAATLKAFATVLASIVTIVSKLNPLFVEFLTAMLTILPVGKFLVGVFLALKAALTGVATAAAITLPALGPLFAAIAVAAALAATVLGTNYARSARKAEEATIKTERALKSMKDRQQELKDVMTSTAVSIRISAESMEEFAQRAEKANRRLEEFGKTEIELADLEKRRKVEEALQQIQDERNNAEDAYIRSIQKARDELSKLPEELQKVARVQADLARVSRSEDSIGAELDLALKTEEDKFSDRITTLRSQAATVREERVRLEKELREALKEALLQQVDNQINEPNRGISNLEGRGLSVALPRGLSDFEKRLEELREKRDRILEVDAGSRTAFQLGLEDELPVLDGIEESARDASRALQLIEVANSRRSEDSARMVELREQEATLNQQLLDVAYSLSQLETLRADKATEALQRELELEEKRTRLVESGSDTQELSIRQRFLTKEAEIQERIESAYREIRLLEETGASDQDDAIQSLNKLIDKYREQIVLLTQITDQRLKQFQLSRQEREDSQDRGVDLVRLQQELETRRQLAALDQRTSDLQLTADVAASRAVSAQQQFEASRKQLQVDLTISQLNQDFLENQRRLLIAQARGTEDAEERARIAGDVFDLETAITEEKNRQTVLGEQDLQLQRQRAQELEASAGFDAGLQRAIDSREAGRVFGSLAEDLASSLETGITGALDAALTGGDVGASIDSMAEYMRQAVIKALVSAFVVNPLLQALLPDAAAGAGSGFPVGESLDLPQPRAEGGPVPGPNMRKALPGHPSSDRTLIAATPGEYVLPTSLTSMLGSGFLDNLRRMTSNAAEMRASILSRIGAFRGPIKPYLGGGPVGSSSPNVVRTDNTRGGSGRTTPVVVVDRKVAQTIMNNPTFTENLRAKSKYVGQGPREYL